MKKTVTITLRLTADEEKILDRVARAHRSTRSEALRSALLEAAARIERNQNLSGYEQLKRHIPAKGSMVKGGKRPDALDSKRLWLEHLLRKHRAIRPD